MESLESLNRADPDPVKAAIRLAGLQEKYIFIQEILDLGKEDE